MITIAGKNTNVGDELWYDALGLWARVTEEGIITVKGVNDQVVKHRFTNDGKIGGKVRLSWHQPIKLSLPTRDITKFQALLDTAVAQFGGI